MPDNFNHVMKKIRRSFQAEVVPKDSGSENSLKKISKIFSEKISRLCKDYAEIYGLLHVVVYNV